MSDRFLDVLMNGFQHINQLIPYINELQKENFKLQARVDRLTQNNKILNQQKEVSYKIADGYYKETHQLKEWLEDMIDYEEYDKIERDTFKKVLSKIQEIEGDMHV